MRIAIIGTGISGNAAAWALTQSTAATKGNQVRVYETRSRTGGHSHTVDIDYDGKSFPVDMGFIVYNTLNYPNLVALFKHLSVETRESDMSFGVSMRNGSLEWSGQSLRTVFAQKKNLVSPRFWTMIRDIFKFNKKAQADLKAGKLGDQTLGDYLKHNKYSAAFISDYLAPMGAAIWSTPHADIMDFPAESFIRFFDNHKLMHSPQERPKWRTVVGGSRSYVEKITAPFQQDIQLSNKVVNVIRKNGLAYLTDESGNQEAYDHIIFASHTGQTLSMMGDATEQERAILGAIKYRPNTIYLHRDIDLMPKDKSVWSAWNYMETTDALQKKTGVCVSYHMNKLQNIDDSCPTFVSLNPKTPPRTELTFHVAHFDHPQFNQEALQAQQELSAIQGQNIFSYCGAWCGYGFHEDGLKAGLSVAENLGAQIPWRFNAKKKSLHLEAAE